MKGFLTNFRYYGTSLGHPRWQNRNIVIANNISLFCCFANLLLFCLHTISHPTDRSQYIGLLYAFIHLSIPYLHRAGFINFGRTLLTITLVCGTLVYTMTRKFTSVDLPMNTFFQSRTALLVFSIVPLATIHFSERRLLIINLLIGLFTLMLFDPIHNALGIGFYQLGFADPDYYYTNVIFFIVYLVLISAAGFFKFEMDTYEKRNEGLIETLHNNNILIAEQKEELTTQGEVLRELLQEKDKDLSEVTRQLINFNHELLQYSYTVSHNLRGPVARILGLLDLYLNYSDEKEKKNVIDLIVESTRQLDNITLDLNKIVEVRSDTFSVREKVNFRNELGQIRQLLASAIKTYNVNLTEDLAVSEIFSLRPRINHLLFILITNAIQYRRPDHRPKIMVRTYQKDKWVVLEVQDNGQGIDLTTYKDDLFKPFKIFHPNASGKGTSLYLAKLQAEKLEGKIEVRSTPGEGATFSVYLKDWRSYN